MAFRPSRRPQAQRVVIDPVIGAAEGPYQLNAATREEAQSRLHADEKAGGAHNPSTMPGNDLGHDALIVVKQRPRSGLVQAHQTAVAKDVGDSLLAEFPSSVMAVQEARA
jgi:hypothetical protein